LLGEEETRYRREQRIQIYLYTTTGLLENSLESGSLHGSVGRPVHLGKVLWSGDVACGAAIP
jgi:hypothetical protein